MPSPELDNLVQIGTLKRESPREPELKGLWRSGESRLTDAARTDLSFESRFDLCYNAAHALALYALRRLGYRSDTRYVVFQALPHTAGLQRGRWRVLAKAHERSNAAEYEGYLEWSTIGSSSKTCWPRRARSSTLSPKENDHRFWPFAARATASLDLAAGQVKYRPVDLDNQRIRGWPLL